MTELNKNFELEENQILLTFGDVIKAEGYEKGSELSVVIEAYPEGIQAGRILDYTEGEEVISGPGSYNSRLIEVVDHWDKKKVINAVARHFVRDIENPTDEDTEVFRGIFERCAERSEQSGGYVQTNY
jgi:hypothetical protein